MLKAVDISFSYQDHPVLNRISFTIEKGGHLAVMGESGSGKSTLLKAVYGLLHLDNGSISWGDKPLLGPNYQLVAGEAFIKYVSQDFDLMPFTSVAENIGQFLSVFEQEQHEERIAELIALVGLEPYQDTHVKNLSGGQKQRVALARALAEEPEILLLDEPFSHIDQFKKNELREKLFPYLKEKGITVLTASHDSADVLPYTDSILVLRNGAIEDYQTTQALFNNPRNKYVASLFGAVNELPLKLLKEYAEINASILVYPHEFELSKKSGLAVTVIANYFKGNHYLVKGESQEGHEVFFQSKVAFKAGITLFLNISLQLVNQRIRQSVDSLSSKSDHS